MASITKTCLVEDCGNRFYAKGYCNKHYQRLRNLNDVDKTLRNNHGRANTTEWYSWKHMKQRCYLKTHPKFHYWGGRGITVCARWREKPNGFINFLSDVGKKFGPEYTLDRIDNNGNYEPSNCRWATPHQQRINQRRVVG